MSSRLFPAILSCVLFTVVAHAATLRIGDIAVTLGGDGPATIRQLSELYVLQPGQQTEAFAQYFVRKKHSEEYLGSIAIHKGIVSSVIRYWDLGSRLGKRGQTSVEIADALRSALLDATSSQGTNCVIDTPEFPDPQITTRAVTFSCGERAVILSLLHHDSTEEAQVTEEIGLKLKRRQRDR